jgi:hypothetical protein
MTLTPKLRSIALHVVSQGTLTEGEGSVRSTSSLSLLVL